MVSQLPNFLILPFLILIAAAIGSFIGMLSYRLPKILAKNWAKECRQYLAEYKDQEGQEKKSLSLALPLSFCPSCNTPLRVIHNIPLISYLFLRGKCSYCKTSITPDYFIAEASVIMLAIILYLNYGLTFKTANLAIFNACIIALMLIDARHGILPDGITLPLTWGALLLAVLAIHPNTLDSSQAIQGAIIGYCFLALPAYLVKLVIKKEAIGGGDSKMMAAVGAWFGAGAVLPVLLTASLLGIVYALLRNVKMGKPIYFGPFIGIGIFAHQFIFILFSFTII